MGNKPLCRTLDPPDRKRKKHPFETSGSTPQKDDHVGECTYDKKNRNDNEIVDVFTCILLGCQFGDKIRHSAIGNNPLCRSLDPQNFEKVKKATFSPKIGQKKMRKAQKSGPPIK